MEKPSSYFVTDRDQAFLNLAELWRIRIEWLRIELSRLEKDKRANQEAEASVRIGQLADCANDLELLVRTGVSRPPA